ncbi:Eco57I restriction-modification methylase domain-containing protein [Deinococcus sp. QL22]|uniref:Eco57I restriction-modification methylase domain-containing protein n=1 Tax=Deinococcus sp. QL22 TaxID=2939437 RepID=UPI002016F259|nr:N-6 DNA methylase [Deinococcus sp. QL22]UQN08792.1 BREX-1 system adenine-specific DNA-methyltransferase PglX [Deinococcus sp. QL22]
MPALETPLRKILEKKVIEARETAESAAAAALARLIGDGPTAPSYLTSDELTLREMLLAKQSQLGSRDALTRECAYEQWHAMLFARFLEASDLLMHPEHGVSVSMDDLDELAQEEGDADAYAAAARYAARMLPGIFRPTDPLLRVRFAPEYRQKLEALIEGIPKPAFVADDSLGWVYQFWQTARKQQVNASGRKISGADISPVTQLFTEHYMVQFMLHNTIGAWWTARNPNQPLPTDQSYLRLNEDGTPAAGSFPGWPAHTRDLKIIDPCCGSGHFLVAAFALLRRLRMLEENLSEIEAAEAVLRDNLHGLELDPRCTQLAAFNLTLEAWKAGGYRPIPTPQIACSGLSIGAGIDDWLSLADDPNTRNVFRILHEEFRDAPDLGSLINPRQSIQKNLGIFGEQALEGLPEVIDALLTREQAHDPAAAIFGDTVQGVARAARLLGDTYHLVITNVPYLGRGNQGDTLKTFIEQRHAAAKADLATAFVERARAFAKPGGTYSLVTPQNWLFLGSYKKLREVLLKEQQWDWVARLGVKSFSTPMWDFNISFVTLTNQMPLRTHEMMGIDVSEAKTTDGKSEALLIGEILKLGQEGQKGNPDSRVALVEALNIPLLSEYADSYQGIKTGDDARFRFNFWEIENLDGFKFFQSTIDVSKDYGGLESVIKWQSSGREISRLQGMKAWGNLGVSVSQMADLPVAVFLGDLFDSNASPIIPKDRTNLTALYAFLSSDIYRDSVREIDQKLAVANATLVKVPFDLPYWQQVAAEKYPNGLPEPYSNDPTQWLFKGRVTETTQPLHVALARLLGYRWPDQIEDGIVLEPDGILPLPGLRAARPAYERLMDTLASVYGASWNAAKLRELLAQVGAESLEGWLQSGFFEGHTKLFHHRPFLWHIWDGRKDGFGAVVNYHLLDRARLEKLTYTYLGAWIDGQRAASAAGEKGAQERLAAALGLQRKLEAILLGEPPYDIYVRWKDLAGQPQGWNPDLNDGVRLNIRPFVEAGVLRGKVNVKWGKDRGNDPGKQDFGEKGPQTDIEKHLSNERHNDLHFTLAEKAEAGKTEIGQA